MMERPKEAARTMEEESMRKLGNAVFIGSLVSATIAAAALGLEGCERHALTPSSNVAGGGGSPPTASESHRLIGVQCFWGRNSSGKVVPLSKIIHEFRADQHGDVVDSAIIFNREFVDNTYGANAVGWGGSGSRARGHTFNDLDHSDHVELAFLDKDGTVHFQGKIDYLTASRTAPSGYASLGMSGGDGRLIAGSMGDILEFGSSLDDNFNRYGYVLTDSSPSTDSSYTPNPKYPNWNFFVEYRIRLRAAAFGASGFGKARMEMVHASPSKFGSNSVGVVEQPCPGPGEPNPFPPCERARPEESCAPPGGSGEGVPNGTPDSANPGSPGGSTPPGSVPPGGPCTSSADCEGGASCEASGTCGAPPSSGGGPGSVPPGSVPPGGSCTSSVDCEGANLCEENGTCGMPPSSGGGMGSVPPGSVPPGGPCTADEDCAQGGSCAATGMCVPPL
jgi:hypothetical protein